jgi:hypothetical protein
MKAFWESEYKPLAVPDIAPEVETAIRAQSKFEKFLEGQSQNDPSTSGDEYDEWCKLKPVKHHNALSYWVENRSRWPRLARMAMDIFSIPAMSAEPERVFSLAGAMCSPRRNRLKAESIQACQCLRSWDNAGIIEDLFTEFDDADPPDTGDVEDVDELAQAFGDLEIEEDFEDEEVDEDE